MQIFSVIEMKAPTYEYAQALSDWAPKTFYYAFNYLGRHSIYDIVFVTNKPPIPHGVTHADELLYLWVFPFPEGSDNNNRKLNASEQTVSDRMIQVWTNFVINGFDLHFRLLRILKFGTLYLFI